MPCPVFRATRRGGVEVMPSFVVQSAITAGCCVRTLSYSYGAQACDGPDQRKSAFCGDIKVSDVL